MTHGNLPFQYSSVNSSNQLTSFSGLPLYIEMANVSGLASSISKVLKTKRRGWSDEQIILALILLNLVGGDCVEDIDRLANDEGLAELMLKLKTYGLKRNKRRELKSRWRKETQRAFPSPSAIRRYLEQFHNHDEEDIRVEGKAFIPSKNELLLALSTLNNSLIDFSQKKNPFKIATLDQDATLVSTHKSSALYCYEKYKAYQPFNTYWHEQGMLLSSEFRDGNVPAGYEQLRILKDDLRKLPVDVEKVYLRSDSAGYQVELLEYCAEGINERFGVIEFAISAKVSQHFKLAVSEVEEKNWQPLFKKSPQGETLKTDQEWAEVCFVPSWVSHCKKNPEYRYVAIREKLMVQKELTFDEVEQIELPFQTVELENKNYKLFGVVTNRDLPGSDLINWHRERCGDSEKVHSVEKSELAGGQLPSKLFGANAAWWQIMVLSFNLNSLMKKFVVPDEFKKKSLKGLRLHVINVAGQVVRHSRSVVIKLSGGKKVVDRLCEMKRRILELGRGPPATIACS